MFKGQRLRALLNTTYNLERVTACKTPRGNLRLMCIVGVYSRSLFNSLVQACSIFYLPNVAVNLFNSLSSELNEIENNSI